MMSVKPKFLAVSAATHTKTAANLLAEGLDACSLKMTPAQIKLLLEYVSLLDKWNKTYNLTAVRDPSRMIGLHILDSLSLLPFLGASELLDVGSGGGLPGVPLAIARPELRITMLDSLQKKTTFIRQAIGELGLENAEVVCERVERFQPAKRFPIVVSRAFAELRDFVHGAAHLVAENGRMVAMKGVYPHEEISRLPSSHMVERVIELDVPQVDGKRHLVVLKKA